jgi:gluconate 5-dehydrogenase
MNVDRQQRLAGLTALVTGAGRGIGRAIALELALDGAHVFALGRTRELLDETCTSIHTRGATCDVILADLEREESRALLGHVLARTDVLVNNAAAFARYGNIEELAPAELQRVLATNVLAPLHLIGLAMPGMKARGFGRIVNIGSIAGEVGAQRQVVYASTKAALDGMTRSVALEGARHGVTCNLLDLGLIETERIAEAVPADVQRALIASTPLGRAGTVEEVASVVAFLATRRAGFVTGARIPVSGGLGLGLFPRSPDNS